jgi:hypothetical protein
VLKFKKMRASNKKYYSLILILFLFIIYDHYEDNRMLAVSSNDLVIKQNAEQKQKEIVKKEETIVKPPQKAESITKQEKVTTTKETESKEIRQQEEIFTVSSQNGWQDTGIEISKGDHVIIKYVSGQWTTHNADPWFDGRGYLGRKSGDFTHGSLIGRTGNENPFAIGNYYEIKEADKEGKLYVRMNEGDGLLNDNIGSIKIQIIIDEEN